MKNKNLQELIKKYPNAKSIQEVFYHESGGYWPDFLIHRPKFEKWIQANGITVVFDKKHKWQPLYVK